MTGSVGGTDGEEGGKLRGVVCDGLFCDWRSMTIVGDHGEAEAVRTQGFKRSNVQAFKLQASSFKLYYSRLWPSAQSYLQC